MLRSISTNSRRLRNPLTSRSNPRVVANILNVDARGHRFASTSSVRKFAPYVGAGVAGGAIVVLGGYAWYHFSGVKKAVDTSMAVKDYYFATHKSLKEGASKRSNAAIEFLRKTAKTYVGIIPGASHMVDSVFDTLDEVHEKHREEVDRIVSEGYNEVQDVIKDGEGASNVQTGVKVLGVVKRIGTELANVGKKAGQHSFNSLRDRHPQIAEHLETGYQGLREMAERSGPEGARIFEETMQQVSDIFKKGVPVQGLNQAQALIQEKANHLRELSQGSSRGAWNQATEKLTNFLSSRNARSSRDSSSAELESSDREGEK